MSHPHLIHGFEHIPYQPEVFEEKEMIARSREYFEWLEDRRSVRHFSDKKVPKEIIEHVIKSASTAPSGAHKQPWTFCAVSDPVLKKKIREAAEEEERENYDSRMSDRWKADLKPMATDANKPFLEIAPWLIIVFKQVYGFDEKGEKANHYYVNESVGLAAGFLISAIHNAGLVTLTHTPSPMNFLEKILNRPKNERAFLLLPVGYAAADAFVPNNRRKTLKEMSVFFE